MAFLAIGGPNSPSIEVAMDITNDPTSATTTWTDITPYVVSYSRQPVRTNEFDQPGPAQATIVLRNDDARFTPDNASGIWFGKLKSYRRFRVRAQWAGVTYNRYFGYNLDWPQSWAAYGRDQTVTVTLGDGLIPLETDDLQGTSYASKLSGAAINDVLVTTAGGFTFWTTALDTGISTIVASGVLPTQSWALQRIKDIAASENGVCYAAGDGTITFHDRHRRITNGASVNVQATIGDGGGNEIPYLNPDPAYGDVWPTVQVTPSGGAIQSYTTTSGFAGYFGRTLNFPTGGQYLVSSATEALAAAQYLSNRYAAPATRVRSLTLVGAAAPALWPQILSLDTSSKVLFKRRPLINGVPTGTITLTQYVEGYGEDVQVGRDWRVTTPLSPADIQTYWVLGDAVLGLLGQTTKLSY